MSDYDRMTRAELLERGGEALARLTLPRLRGFVRAVEEAADAATRERLLARLAVDAAELTTDEVRALVWTLERRKVRKAAAPPELRLVGNPGDDPAPEPPPKPAA